MYSQGLCRHQAASQETGQTDYPRGTAGYYLYAAAANQEARIESRDLQHHCKQTWWSVDQIHPFITMFPSGTKTSR